jgi:hypothetical protein
MARSIGTRMSAPSSAGSAINNPIDASLTYACREFCMPIDVTRSVHRARRVAAA